MAEERDPSVWIVSAHRREKPDLEPLRKAIENHFQDLGRVVKVLRTRKVPSRAAGENGRSYEVLEPQDAFRLYNGLHVQPSAVFQLSKARVVKNPKSGPTSQNLIALERFVRYKAAFAHANLEVDWRDSLHRVISWLSSTSCTGERDARCLPLHVFCPDGDWVDLSAEQDSFERAHGKAGGRADERGRPWQKDQAHHGTPVDCVAGLALQRGLHWDVQADRNVTTIWNAGEVWSLKPGGHLNVYPSATIRGGHASKMVYKAARPSVEATGGPREPLRVPKGRRKPRRGGER